jgi:hypothetical protein
MKSKIILYAILFITLFPALSHAEVTIFSQDDWKVGLGGFIEFDSFYDTTRSFVETVGSGAVAKKGTYNGDNGRTQFSMRNTRLSFNVQAPEVDGWKTRGYLETDFLGYDPNPNSGNVGSTQNSEAANQTNPTLRIRHAYIAADRGAFQLLVGQTWSLFGWQPVYVLSSISVNPVTGSSYQRTPRIGGLQTLQLSDTNSLQVGASIERPTQKDGKIPNLVVAARWLDNGRKSGFTGPNSDIKALPMSFGLSGTYRNFTPGSNGGTTANGSSLSAFALAANALVPILTSSDGKDVSNTLTASGEFTAGRGYGDEFPSWSGGQAQAFTGAAPSATANTNLDTGIGGYNQAGNFDLIKLRTWNAQLQYHVDGKTFFTAGYGQLYSSNISDYAPAAASGIYDRVQAKFVNVGHDFTSHVRLALEFDQFNTHYVDGSTNFDNRYMLASYFRF